MVLYICKNTHNFLFSQFLEPFFVRKTTKRLFLCHLLAVAATSPAAVMCV